MGTKVGLLTERQAEVLRFEALGYSQEEIARALGISQPRVSSALKAAKEKVEMAGVTLEFYKEVTYIGEQKRAGYKGYLVLGEGP
ncbi:MAG: sigma factor-like helix-turn-helix DNA-binding protein [Candidatus Hydrothermarchaeota archaeon]